ncbi:unnamed protein product [Allacma fusca]|uniref:Complex III assembly factor LYRM7 n=1 Tax=Allacma fusca TaxID=39272 RepID=A0A8J2JBP8_9HEXA|nr:unnamed protein product [Allacma fusca]
MMASRTKILSLFKTLHRTREAVFRGDDHALKGDESYMEYSIHGQKLSITFHSHSGQYPWESQEGSGSVKSDKRRNPLEKLSSCADTTPVKYLQSVYRKKRKKETFREFVVERAGSSFWCYLYFFVTLQLLPMFYVCIYEVHTIQLLSFEVALAVLMLFHCARKIETEKLMVLPSLGLQISQETVFGKIRSCEYVPLPNIKANHNMITREKINEEFRKHSTVSNPEEIKKLIQVASESNDILRTKVLQAQEIRPQVYQIRSEHLRQKCTNVREGCGRPDCHCVP